MKKRFYHAAGWKENQKIYCSECGALLDNNLMATTPCSVVTAARSILPNDLQMEISVWNCCAELIVFKEEDGKRKYYQIQTDKKNRKKIARLTEKSVYDCGGAISFSGIYPLNDELEAYIESLLKKGKISFVEE